MGVDYCIKECSDFSAQFKDVSKQFKYTFEKDYQRALQVITKRLQMYDKQKEVHKFIPNTRKVERVGEEVKLPVLKTDVYISEARDHRGRLIYLLDKEKRLIFLIDVYFHPKTMNHDVGRIRKAYLEYLGLDGSNSSSESQNNVNNT